MLRWSHYNNYRHYCNLLVPLFLPPPPPQVRSSTKDVVHISRSDIESMSTAEVGSKAPEFYLVARGVILQPGTNKVTLTGKVSTSRLDVQSHRLMAFVCIIRASLSEPHIDGTSAARVCHILLSIVRQRGPGGPNSSRAAARRRPRIWSRHARRRRPADSHVYVCTVLSACWLTTYGFATSMNTTGSSQNRDERLRCRRERERTRRAGETAEQRERRLRQRQEWDRD